jgi:hypothetical protein
MKMLASVNYSGGVIEPMKELPLSQLEPPTPYILRTVSSVVHIKPGSIRKFPPGEMAKQTGVPQPPPPPAFRANIDIVISNALLRRSYSAYALYISISHDLKGEKNKEFSSMRLSFPARFDLSQTNVPIPVVFSPETNTLQGFFVPTLVPWNPTPTAVLQLKLDDLGLADGKDALILIWGAVIGAGAALLADAMSKLGAQLLKCSA